MTSTAIRKARSARTVLSAGSMAWPRSYLPVMLALFVGSGCAALIYEIVWLQTLELVLGSTALSQGVLLATFMGGLCVGSLLLPRLVSTHHHPLMVYSMLELGIGVIGVLIHFGMPALAGIYIGAVGNGMPGLALRAVIAAICLLPPTVLMGATLPAISRWVEANQEGVSWLGYFYSGNIVGAVLGCVLAGFYLLPTFNLAVATFTAVAINAAVASIGMVLASRSWSVRASENPAGPARRAGSDVGRATSQPSAIYVAIALSGLTALGAEVVWTRLLSLLLGATVYAFSIILAAFLLGLGMGSSAGSLMARTTRQPGLLLAGCQILLGAAVAWTAFTIGVMLPNWPIDAELTTGIRSTFAFDILRCMLAVLPPAILWGASFPFALSAVTRPESDAGKQVAAVYAANTVGAITGALVFSLLLIPHPAIGTQNSQRLLIALSAASGVIVLLAQRAAWRKARTAALVAIVVASVLAWTVPPVPSDLIGYGRRAWTLTDPKARPDIQRRKYLLVREGMNSSVAVTETPVLDPRGNAVVDPRGQPMKSLNFHVSGRVEATTLPLDMRLQRLLAHVPALLHPNPKRVLVVGFGAGVTAGSFLSYPGVEKIVICEIEPLIPQVVARQFAEQNGNVAADPRVQIVYDDARHYILTTREKFDIITSDPIHPWVKGAATLYTEEYFGHVLQHLNPGGMVTQWVPLYDSDESAVRSELATFFRVFPGGTVWSNDKLGQGYDLLLLGQVDAGGKPQPTVVDVGQLDARLNKPDSVAVKESLAAVGIRDVVALLSRYSTRADDLKDYLAGAEINRDRNLKLQYLAGLGIDQDQEQRIFRRIHSSYRYPDALFVNAGPLAATLRQVLDGSPHPR